MLVGTLAGCSTLKGCWVGLTGSSNAEISDMAPEIPILEVIDALSRQQQALQQHKSLFTDLC
ncbi:hypothetical protein PHAMO_50006 [Magnetospirillum molischianum DSM 120]|uniref:Uncharacterized protein n=1 Tax=Magnetospirillum molischianum DSM 120 TaxID=1150626 RepID=H8FWX3_MAGML|nr:hypothetical protein PHAMO_50006 [Magnetospirillum molischianum DSM 120]